MRRSRLLTSTGWVLFVVSFPVWFAVFAAPFLPFSTGTRVLLGTGLAIAGEALFWAGGAILGTSAMAHRRRPNVRTGASLAGKTVAVVGATGGLGTAIVDALRREGASVLALGRDAEKLGQLSAERADLRICLADVTSDDSLRTAARDAGPVDVVVCATGADVRKRLAHHSVDEISSLLETNLGGAILVTRAFEPYVRDGGAIVFLGGFGDGRLGLPYYSVDVATRAGVAGFAQSMNRELGLEGRDLRVCYACPAPADTAAERPFAELWQEMGTPPVAAEKVADFVLATILQRTDVAVMGWKSAFISRVNSVSPGMADALGLGNVGEILRGAFGSPTDAKKTAE